MKKSCSQGLRVVSVLCVLALGLGGCSRIHNYSDGQAQMVAAPDKVSALLADAADRASTALETLAAIEQSRGPENAVQPPTNVPVELRRAITTQWVGPPEPILKTLADRAGYVFMTAGDPPPIPVVLSIDSENKPVIDIFRDIGLQLGKRAVLRVDANKKIIELQYPANTGAL